MKSREAMAEGEQLDGLELIHEGTCQLGKGIIWDARTQSLFWIDVEGKKLFRRRASSGANRIKEWTLSGMPGSLVLTQDENLVVLALDTGLTTFNLRSGCEKAVFGFPEDSDQSRFNDGNCDPLGRFWVGTMDRNGAKNAGNLYCVESPLLLGDSARQCGWSVRKVLDSLSIPNGMAWSADGATMYFIDSLTRRVDAFDYDLPSGNMSNRRLAFSLPRDRGIPGEMTIDAEDKLWIAHWDGGCVARYDPATGKTMSTVIVPAPKVTSCSFGGRELKTLYIATAIGSRCGGRTDRRKHPQAGSVFGIEISFTQGRISPVFLK